MDESDSDSDSPAPPRSADKIESKYPVDGLFVSRAEKAEIMSMREVDREQIIAERTAEVEQERQNRLLRQLVNSQELEEKRQKKRKAEEPEEGQRKTSRQRTKLGGTKVGETSAGIDSLKRARAEKSDRQRRREEDLQRQKDKNISPTARRGGDDYDRSDSSDVEWASPSRSRAEPAQEPEKEAPMAELRDVEHIRLGRSRFADVYYKPTLEAAIKDCFAKVRYPGPDKDKADEYRMGMIKGLLNLVHGPRLSLD